MSDIQQARDVLAKWRKDAPWFDAPMIGGTALVDGTAGNPDLLEALDGLLADGQVFIADGLGDLSLPKHAERIAAAIIAADERMKGGAS